MSEIVAPQVRSVDKPPAPLPTGRALTGEVNPRIQELFNQAALAGERSAGVLRTAASALALLRELWFNGADLLAGDPREVVGCSSLTFVVVAGALLLKSSGNAAGWPAVRRRLSLSVALDGVLLLGVMMGIVLWPVPGHRGLLYSVFAPVFPAAVMLSGLRLSRSVAGVSLAVVSSVFVLLCAVDAWRNPEAVYPVGHSVFWAILLASCGAAAVAMTARTRALVLQSAGIVLEVARVRERLGAYVSREVAEHVLSVDDFKLGGGRVEVAVLFSDLRGFTAYSEKVTPEELVAQLNAYLEAMVACIHAEGGVVDKYVGDSIMAVFGAPVSRAEDAASAIRAAFRMQQMLGSHNQDRARRSLPPLQQGIGVHFGSVVAGNVGTAHHAQYTVMGDAVNLASRLQAATKEQGVAILVSSEARAAALAHPGRSDVPAMREIGALAVRGREARVTVFAPTE